MTHSTGTQASTQASSNAKPQASSKLTAMLWRLRWVLLLTSGVIAEVTYWQWFAENGSAKAARTYGMLVWISSAGLLLLFETARRRLSDAQISERLSVPVLGHIPWGNPDQNSATLCTLHRARGPAAHAYRELRTALHFSTRGQSRPSIGITGAVNTEHHAIIGANLGVTLARSGRRTLIIDATFSEPGVASALKAESSHPTDSAAHWQVRVQPTEIDDLHVLKWYRSCDHDVDVVLASLRQIRDEYDVLLVPMGPVESGGTAPQITDHLDGMVVLLDQTPIGGVCEEQAMKCLKRVRGNVLGIVVLGDGVVPTTSVTWPQGLSQTGEFKLPTQLAERSEKNAAKDSASRRTA